MSPRFLLPLALLLVAPLGAAERTGRPLLELEGRGTRVTILSIPFCGAGCPLERDPRFVSYRLQVLHDGRVSATLSENRIGNPDAAVARVVDGRGDPTAFAALKAQLAAARIGHATGGCRVVVELSPPRDDLQAADFAALSYRLLWYGAGDRARLLDLPQESGEVCPQPLRELVQRALDYASAVTAAPAVDADAAER